MEDSIPRASHHSRGPGKISDPLVIVESARRKARRIILTEDGLARIDRKGRWFAQE